MNPTETKPTPDISPQTVLPETTSTRPEGLEEYLAREAERIRPKSTADVREPVIERKPDEAKPDEAKPDEAKPDEAKPVPPPVAKDESDPGEKVESAGEKPKARSARASKSARTSADEAVIRVLEVLQRQGLLNPAVTASTASTSAPAPGPSPVSNVGEGNGEREDEAAKEKKWIEGVLQSPIMARLAPELTEEQYEQLLAGGKEAVETFRRLAAEIAARALLYARKSIYHDLNPVLSDVMSKLEPAYQQAEHLTRTAVEQYFVHKYPEAAPMLDTFRMVAEYLVRQQQAKPDQYRWASLDDFLKTVYELGSAYLDEEYRKWNPSAKSWREAVSARKPATGAAPTASTTASSSSSSSSPPPPAANRPVVAPPGTKQSWDVNVAQSLLE